MKYCLKFVASLNIRFCTDVCPIMFWLSAMDFTLSPTDKQYALKHILFLRKVIDCFCMI